MKIKNLIIVVLLAIFSINITIGQTVIGVVDKKSYNIGDRIEFSFKIPFVLYILKVYVPFSVTLYE